MPRVYIETTIPSFYFETRTSPQIVAWRDITRAWWARQRRHYELVTSIVVFDELRRAPAGKAAEAATLIADLPLLDDRPEVREVASYYIDHRLMPADAAGDAAHLAFASVHGVEFLLTWNCRHLANANKTTHLAALNARLGLGSPILTTPFNLTKEAP